MFLHLFSQHMCGISQQGSERRSVESLCLAQDLAQDDTMLLPPAFVTNTASVCFQNLAHSCHRTSPGSPLQSAISGNNAQPFASHCHSRALFDRASPSHPKTASGHSVTISSSAACCIDGTTSRPTRWLLGLLSPH